MASKEDSGGLEVQLPDNVNVEVAGSVVKVSGERGEVSKEFKSPKISISKKDGVIYVSSKSKKKRDMACVGTIRAHIQNMVKGVTNGVSYDMKIVYSHFPMNLKVDAGKVVIDNFLGEKTPRFARVLGGVEVKVNGQDVNVSGIDLENVSQTAANIEQATKIKNLDPRVFQDGVYITVKDGKPIK